MTTLFILSKLSELSKIQTANEVIKKNSLKTDSKRAESVSTHYSEVRAPDYKG